jgi:vacuolar-type H+-ATPase subunit E/Vma4
LVVTASDGRRRSDQTFAARLARLRPELRMQVAELVGADS